MNNSSATHFISASLPYVNATPHLGYAFELVLADTLARWRRASGHDVVLVSGTDDNSLKNVRAAHAAGVDVQSFVDDRARGFERLAESLAVRPDGFVRTSRDAGHQFAVRHVFERCRERGDVYKKRYRGRYCVGCEQFYGPRGLPGGLCPVHEREPEVVEEENWFFRLSRYEPLLLELLRSRKLTIVPEERHIEALRFVERGLSDFSVSRSRERAHGWGIPVPGDDRQVVYVWFDALVGYPSALGFPTPASRYERYWTGAASRLHVIGKDILRFHAVYWPAILLAIGEALPTHLLVHGFITIDGKKISKSHGDAVDPFPLLERYGSDALRYYLARHVHTTVDCDFSEQRLLESHDAELADQLGNLVSRTLALVERYGEGRCPTAAAADARRDPRRGEALELELRADCARAAAASEAALEGLDVSAASKAWFQSVVLPNRYLDRAAPWKLARGNEADRVRLFTVLHEVLSGITTAARDLAALLPTASARVLSTLSRETIAQPAPLFPKARQREW